MFHVMTVCYIVDTGGIVDMSCTVHIRCRYVRRSIHCYEMFSIKRLLRSVCVGVIAACLHYT